MVVCFLTAPGMRGKGIATRFLEHVCADAVKDGYDYIEGYPPVDNCDEYSAYHGTIPFFGKHEFEVYKKNGE